MTLHQALAARGFGSRKATDAQRREIFCSATGLVMGQFDAHEAWRWLRACA
jgi:hypothetical protein